MLTPDTQSPSQTAEFPTLYKLSSAGKLLVWNVRVEGATIINSHGQEGGVIQESPDTIKEGKSLGTSAETTPEEQAMKEAKSRWEKQQKHKGYVQDREKAMVGERLRDAPVPMLAHPIDQTKSGKHVCNRHRIKYPVAAQPKLDGMRCLARYRDGEVTLHARTGDVLRNVPHINKRLKEIFDEKGIEDIVLDGELYCHKLNRNFSKILSIIKRVNEIHPEHELIEYHVYDLHNLELSFFDRHKFIVGAILPQDDPHIKIVETKFFNNEDEWSEYFINCLESGYEGTMLRNIQSQYVSKRSYDILKLKEFVEEEFKIIGVKEGRGKLQGCAAKFVCLTKRGEEFEAKLAAPDEDLRKYFEDHSMWKGKWLTVRFLGYTEYNIPRGPVGKCLRAGVGVDILEQE